MFLLAEGLLFRLGGLPPLRVTGRILGKEGEETKIMSFLSEK